ncbi:MAG: hypothetical protein BWY53_00138 [Parcubacteria group bacterium ADurb.Bin326]|nr:MAG: hypothetical protein BWY53_00138 [Parcubacteria group bacterium ADurb.Bin326]
MSGILKKYGKHLASFAILAILLVPLAVGAQTLGNTVSGENSQLGKSQLGTTFGANTDQNALAKMIGAGVNVVLGMLGLILVVLIIYAGFIWTTAQGDSKKVDKAKDMIKQAVIGLIIVFAAYAIAQFVMINLANVASGNTTG